MGSSSLNDKESKACARVNAEAAQALALMAVSVPAIPSDEENGPN